MVVSDVPDVVEADWLLGGPLDLAGVRGSSSWGQAHSDRFDILEFRDLMGLHDWWVDLGVAQEESLFDAQEDQVDIVRNLVKS